MRKETFLAIIKNMRTHAERKSLAMQAGIDIIDFDTHLYKVVDKLLEYQFGEGNYEIITMHLDNDGVLGDILSKESEVLATIETDEDLWQYLQDEAERENLPLKPHSNFFHILSFLM